MGNYAEYDFTSGISDGRFSTAVFDELLEGAAGYAQGPERALLSALLFDGLQSFIAYALAVTAKERNKHAEAFNWVMKTSQDYTFSFENVCEALGIQPDWLRVGLLNASNSLLSEVSKVRRSN
jgi:hypothetical protein